MSVLNNPVLVLNKSWAPYTCSVVHEALNNLYEGKVCALDAENYILYNWDGWRELPIIGDMPKVNTVRFAIRAPRFIVQQQYNRIPHFEVKMNMRNIWLRDGCRCQYTGRKLALREATKDHIIPESRGGKDTWENLVTCCPHINKKKANRTPQEAGLRLLSVPKKPKWSPLFSALYNGNGIPEDFKKFLPQLAEYEETLKAAME